MELQVSSGPPPEGAQAVKVAVHIRPLVAAELLQGCKDCVSLIHGEPQVQIGNHTFTFDHVYGSAGSPSSSIFPECVLPLVEGAFQGYNATVLAYGQTGSGKTYTMGTGYIVGGSTDGVIPQTMHTIFQKVSTLKEKSEFRIRVSFIEILKEEVHDLLDPNPPIAIKSDGIKAGPVGKPPIQIRENTNGEITLAGVTEVDVGSLEEMASCLERGSLCRATASTNMNSRSSRSHAIFTITLEQKRIIDLKPGAGANCNDDDVGDDFLCAKLHLVDLAGSERAKRTGADGVRFKEGVHINKGLLALGNVISALGDEKKRKEGGHVPYRDSKLTRLLQDSLGGNSRTVMIACISPADSNAEETLNTLKYANRARNIQNKPVVNRDPVAAEMQRMRQQVELLQAELLCVREGGSVEEMQLLKQRIVLLETSLLELQQELKAARQDLHLGAQRLLETQVERDKLQLKLDILEGGKSEEGICGGETHKSIVLLESYADRIKTLETEVHQLRNDASLALHSGDHKYQRAMFVDDNDSPILSLSEERGIETSDIEEETVAKEMEHARLQDSLDKELEELNKRLEQKEAEMKSFAKCDGVVLKQHFEKKIVELEEEKKVLQNERDMLLFELTRLSNASDEQSQKLQETYMLKVKALETQISELRKKQENQSNLLKQKQRSDEAAKRLQEDIQRIKSQKVQLQNKIKQESEQFRTWKALREKEVLQLKKERRRNEYEMHKLQALHQRQKMVLQRKTEECAAATRRLNELLESRKALSRDNLVTGTATTGTGSVRQTSSERSLKQSIDDELEVALRIHEVRSNHKKQSETRAAFAKELQKLKQEDVKARETTAYGSNLTMSPGARQAKIALLESMLNSSSSALVAMASQLSEAEERERAFSGRARWQHLRSMADAKSLLQYVFSSAVEARCRTWDSEVECKELKEKVSELTILLKQSEAHLQERDRKQLAKEQQIAKMVASAAKVGTITSMRNCLDEISKSLLRVGEIGPKQLEYPDDISGHEEPNSTRKKVESSSEHGSEPDVTDISEVEESDMDIDFDDDASDEDWRPCKDKARRSKGGKNQDTLQKQKSFGDADVKSNPDSALCCSCGRTSGCKTNKCACRAAGSMCGDNCQCLSQKCANREPSVEVAEALEMLTLDKEIRHAQTSQSKEGNGNTNELDEVLKRADVQRAEQVLVEHGVDVLVTALDNAPERTESPSVSGEPETESDLHTEKRHSRRPLSDIGNYTQVEESDGQPKLKQRKRWAKGPVQKVTVQLVPTTEPVQNENQPPEDIPEPKGSTVPSTRNAATAETLIARDSEMEGLLPPPARPPLTAPSQFTVGLYRDRPSHFHDRKVHRNNSSKHKPSPPSSPLRARNVHANEEASNMNKKFPETSGSPRAPGKGVLRDKENL